MLRFYDQKYGDMKWWVVIFKMGYEWRYLSAIVSAPWSKHRIWFMVVHLISGYIILVSINGWLEDGGPRFHVGFLVKSMKENKWAWLKTGASVPRCVTPSKQIRLNPWMRNFGMSLIQLGFTSRAKKRHTYAMPWAPFNHTESHPSSWSRGGRRPSPVRYTFVLHQSCKKWLWLRDRN